MATTIQDLEERVDALYNSVLQMQANLNPVTERADTAYNGVQSLTPYTETKTGYIGDRSIDFVSIPEGNITVFGIEQNYKMTKTGSYLFIEWETPLEEVTKITISIS